jgi:hypothetical protein
MPPGKQQSNTMLYTLVAFVGLFILATAGAVVFYVKAEEHRKSANDLERQMRDMATTGERSKLGAIVGTKKSGQSWLGQMVEYLDQAITLIVGGVPEPTSAEVKVSEAGTKVENALTPAQKYLDITDPAKTGLVQVIEELSAKLDYSTSANADLQKQFDNLQKRYDDDMKANFEKEQVLLAEKEKYKQQVEDTQQDYKELEELLRKTTDEQVQTLSAQLNEERANLRTTSQDLFKTQAELKESEELMRRAQQELRKIKPAPDREVAAFKPDGEIILVNNQDKIVHLSIGSDDHAYRGMRFTVYDKSTSVTKDGGGKAEVEIFDIAKNHSAARIIRSEINRPILEGDVVANLIWDSGKTNVFVIAGDFDLNNDGVVDYDAVDKIKALIEKWGGKVADEVSIDTDFLVLGSAPMVYREPTREELETDPTAMQQYNAALRRLNQYKETQSRAENLWIPIFNYERFLYLIGYKGTSVF